MVSVVYLLSLVHESVSGFQAYPVFSLSPKRESPVNSRLQIPEGELPQTVRGLAERVVSEAENEGEIQIQVLLLFISWSQISKGVHIWK